MRLLVQRLVVGLTAACLVACAASPTRFYSDRYSLSDTRLCRTYDKAAKLPDGTFWGDVREEIDRRGLSPERCQQLERQQNLAIGAAAAIATAAVVIAAEDRHKGGGGGGYVAPEVYDTEWDWDQFYRGGVLVWECRGVQTGQFAPTFRCAGLPITDRRWPNK